MNPAPGASEEDALSTPPRPTWPVRAKHALLSSNINILTQLNLLSNRISVDPKNSKIIQGAQVFKDILIVVLSPMACTVEAK